MPPERQLKVNLGNLHDFPNRSRWSRPLRPWPGLLSPQGPLPFYSNPTERLPEPQQTPRGITRDQYPGCPGPATRAGGPARTAYYLVIDKIVVIHCARWSWWKTLQPAEAARKLPAPFFHPFSTFPPSPGPAPRFSTTRPPARKAASPGAPRFPPPAPCRSAPGPGP